MLNNFSIKSKLLLSMLFPILGMIYFAFVNINDRYHKSESSENIYNIATLNIKISSVVHELQKERGNSSGFLSSKGKKFSYELNEQKKITDIEINKLMQHLLSFNSDNDIKNEIAKEMAKLNTIRSQTTLLSLEAEDLIKEYTDINSFLLDFIYITSKDTDNNEITEIILTYSNFLFLKERTGIERALVTNMLIDNKDYSINRLKLSNLIVLQRFFLNKFFVLSKDNVIKDFYKSIYDEELSNEIKRIENIILFSDDKYEIEPSYWFEKMTLKIDKYNKIANELSKQLMNISVEQKKKAQDDMLMYNIITIVILLIAISFFLAIMRNINISVNQILRSIKNISKSKTSEFKKIKIRAEDEFRTIADALNKMAESIQHRNAESVLKNKELKEAEKKAVLSAKAKSEFLANMSHEIRTPLNAILGFIDILKEESVGRKSSEYVDIIKNSSTLLLKIIEDILDFSKIESGKLDIDKIDFNTKAEFEVIIHLFQAKSSQKNISLVLNLDKNIPQIINTDPLRVKQVISNLLSNAVKFTSDSKTIIVDISYDNKFLNVSVKDEGIGISEDKLTHIFEAFGQEDSSTTRKYGGTGLGLSISSELVKLLGGELKVKSKVGVGSEFYFSILVGVGKELKIEDYNIEQINFKNRKILLVEDNKANQMYMKVLFKKMNLEFNIANDGLEAIEAFKENKYDLILMDENMPNLNGMEATKRILSIEKEQSLKHTPIVALTANSLKGDREKFLKAGLDEYLTKPIDKKKLREVLGSFLKTKEDI
jgi:signal transduction histidine kinase/CheY-like chemotaxis protein